MLKLGSRLLLLLRPQGVGGGGFIPSGLNLILLENGSDWFITEDGRSILQE